MSEFWLGFSALFFGKYRCYRCQKTFPNKIPVFIQRGKPEFIDNFKLLEHVAGTRHKFCDDCSDKMSRWDERPKDELEDLIADAFHDHLGVPKSMIHESTRELKRQNND